MQDVRSSNPYTKHVRYLGEINRLKRITIFLRTVTTLCDVDNVDRRYQRGALAADHGEEAEEKAFIEDCRLRLQAVSECNKYPEVYDDLLCRFIIDYARKAAQRRVPLVGDCNRLKNLARFYHDGHIKDVVTALIASYVNNTAPGRADQGVNVRITLTQRNALKVIGGTPELRKKVKAALSSLPKLPNKEDATRKGFLSTAVRTTLEQTAVPGWHCNYIEVAAAEYAVYNDGSLRPLADIQPTAGDYHGGFYEHAFLLLTIQQLSPEQQQAIGKFLRPKDFDGNMTNLIRTADTEDIYRVLTYLHRLKRPAVKPATTTEQ
jgi:hypothetical protein